MSEPILKVENLNRYFGALHATKNVSFEIEEGEVRAISLTKRLWLRIGKRKLFPEG